MQKARVCILFIAVLGVTLLTNCAHQPIPEAYDPPGFFSGLIHGIIIVPAFIGSFFTDIRIYAFPNSGGWYDFGYLIGAGIFLGSSAAR